MSRLSPLAVLCLLLAQLSAAATGSAESYVTLSENDCARLARHYPAPDVAYQPGRDVRGRAVAPADLQPHAGLVLPDTVVVPIEVELFERYGIPGNGTTFKGDLFVGEVVVDVATGQATFNGQPLASDAEAELAARCQRILRDRTAQ